MPDIRDQQRTMALRIPGLPHAAVPAAVRSVLGLAMVAAVAVTPGFFSSINLLSLLTSMSLVGCVAVAMTFITLSGNIVSFSLGATLSATTIVLMASLDHGLWPAVGLALLFSMAITGVQGWIVGYFRANPVIVSLAMLSLIYGVANWATGGRGIYPTATELDVFKGRVAGLPIPLLAFAASVLLAQGLLSLTRMGRHAIMIGANERAATAAGIDVPGTITWVYVAAGLFTGIAAVLIAARHASGDMEHGIGLDYAAISAVIVGGNAIEGGRGSALRTAGGVLTISIVQGVLILWGFSTSAQALAVGLIVLLILLLHGRRS
ncbi:ABC transporter permease [Rhodoplanes sp. TEM]|uniref:ABC transporter permease n=1 Tax=Rhodoplanes tepidamans TaxID=200616 RepID=A0ABT5J9H8_RHOTP|nr:MULTISPECIES: ABC transporter permease [Rhodoplanes]MDC7785944.1 ABC transporter permease [Rhodoplanes tepidamans]MDC7986244.1 ABC transporter permease [Rhodoplanes sp. TEM]MDQ0355437.1 ribose/xylose/arabinose/galactoside ABC-type transport system permease subunit [Rhodoplanes tepidamans]